MKKNLIIFHTDQQRYDSLGCNGNEYARTKNIDSLAKDGCRFTRHISSNPVCMPSRASLLTGLNVPGHGVISNGIPLWRRDHVGEIEEDLMSKYFGIHLHDKIPTLADILGENGFKTALLGKLHLQAHGADKAYQFYESNPMWEEESNIDFKESFYGFQTHKMILGHGEGTVGFNTGHYGRWILEKYPEIVETVLEDKELRIESGERDDIFWSKVSAKLHHSTWLGEEACDYINQYEDDAPMFMFVGFPDPHRPYSPPAEIAEQFKNIPLPDFSELENIGGEKPKTCQRAMEIKKSSKDDCAKAYRNTMASVHLIDEAIGKVVDTLKEKGIYDNTVIIFTSDHGDYLGDLDMLAKSELPFYNLIHIPFIIKGTKDMTLPSVFDGTMSNVDVVPTVLNMLDVDTPEHIQGVNIFDENISDHSAMVSCFSIVGDERNISLLDETYRYTYYFESGEEELYNHIDDPKEYNNLVNDDSVDVSEICKDFKVKLMEKHIHSESNLFNRYGLW